MRRIHTEADYDDSRARTRAQWGHRVEFVLACIGYTVGLGNVVRFPYLAYKNGGGSFVTVYVFMQLTIGKPMYLMEMAIGQYSGKGPVRAWCMNPAARGVGFSMCLVSFIISVYYNVLIAYCLQYFFATLEPELPWAKCRSGWKWCITNRTQVTNITACTVDSTLDSNCTCSGNQAVDSKLSFACLPRMRTASEIYFHEEVIQQSKTLTLENIRLPIMALTLNLILAWAIVVASIIKGVKSSGKVIYFTSTCPYVILLILFARSAMLEGAMDGLKLFIVPKWSELQKPQLWMDALGQLFFSLGLSTGAVITVSSYSSFHNDVYRDHSIISTMDLIASFLVGFVIFATFGHISHTTGLNIADYAKDNFGLPFIAYPEALSQLPAPRFWTALFFFMLFTLAIDTQIVNVETFLTYLEDDFKFPRAYKVPFRVGTGFVCFLLGLPLVSPGGIYILTILDKYGASYALTAVGCVEVVAVTWIYGLGRFLDDLEYMLGKKPLFLLFWYFSLGFWSPTVMLQSITLFNLFKSETPKYASGGEFSPAVMVFCWSVYAVTILPIPAWLLLYASAVYGKHGFHSFSEFLGLLVRPTLRWGPADELHPLATKRLDTVWSDVCPGLCGPPVLTSPASRRSRSSRVSFSADVVFQDEGRTVNRKRSPPPTVDSTLLSPTLGTEGCRGGSGELSSETQRELPEQSVVAESQP